MAKKHKAATQVTIARTDEETFLHELVRKYTGPAIVVALVITVVAVWASGRAESDRQAAYESWETLEVDVPDLQNPPSVNTLMEVTEELGDTAAAPWAKTLEVGKRLEGDDVSGARQALGELIEEWPGHPTARLAIYPSGDEFVPLATLIDRRVSDLQQWKDAHDSIFSNPPLPEDAPRVKLSTSAGDLVIGLYTEYAPEHVENFLKLCGEAFYDGTKFHRVIQGFMIQGGDPNSRDEDRTTWGQGGPGYTLEPEVGRLWHFPGAVASAATQAGGPTSGSQFYIVTGDDRHHLDGDYTVFGVLLEGQDTVTKIETGATLGETPEEPFEILSTEIL